MKFEVQERTIGDALIHQVFWSQVAESKDGNIYRLHVAVHPKRYEFSMQTDVLNKCRILNFWEGECEDLEKMSKLILIPESVEEEQVVCGFYETVFGHEDRYQLELTLMPYFFVKGSSAKYTQK